MMHLRPIVFVVVVVGASRHRSYDLLIAEATRPTISPTASAFVFQHLYSTKLLTPLITD
jgi:hypothetical protein